MEVLTRTIECPLSLSLILPSPLELFSDPREVEIVFGYGSYLAYHEEITILKRFCVHQKQNPRIHKLRLVKVGGQIIACVELMVDIYLTDRNFKIPDRTLYKLEWMSEGGKLNMHARAFTIDNQFAFPHAKIVLILKGP